MNTKALVSKRTGSGLSCWITLSHSARPLDFSRSSRESLVQRFADPQRLESLPRFADLDGSGAPGWANNITVWFWSRSSGFVLASFVRRSDTVNHALVEGQFGQLVICAHDRLEICGLDGEVRRQMTHPWFAAGHTVHRTGQGNYSVSCSASDAVLTVDRSSLEVLNAWRVPPSLFGGNYDLAIDDDVRRHYIPTDFQVTHINSAYPWRGGLLVTCFIQGAVLHVNRSGSCRVITTGFIGCHGGRANDEGCYYFADSPQGNIVWIGEDGIVSAQVSCDTSWLHDVVWLFEDYYACAISDRNELSIVESATGRVIDVQNLSAYGSTPCLLSSGRL